MQKRVVMTQSFKRDKELLKNELDELSHLNLKIIGKGLTESDAVPFVKKMMENGYTDISAKKDPSRLNLWSVYTFEHDTKPWEK